MTPENYECRKCHQGMYVPDGMDPLDEDVRFCESCAIDEIERLQEIIGHLPKTADGVPVVPGMKVWHCANRHYGPHAGVLFPADGIDVTIPPPYCLGEHCYSEGCQGDDGGGRTWRYEDCYSTREAAEKARKT